MSDLLRRLRFAGAVTFAVGATFASVGAMCLWFYAACLADAGCRTYSGRFDPGWYAGILIAGVVLVAIETWKLAVGRRSP